MIPPQDLKMSPLVEMFFNKFVVNLFSNHPRTPGREVEVLTRDWSHRTNTILECGLTDFATPYNKLGPEDKVLIYCYQYMQMHVASNFYVFNVGMKHGLGELCNWIIPGKAISSVGGHSSALAECP